MKVCDWIFLVCSVFVITLLILLLFLGGRLKPSSNATEQAKFCVKKRNMFLKSSIVWYVTYYSMTLSSLLSTIIVIYLCDFSSPDMERTFFYSVISLFATIINFVLSPKEKAVVNRQCFNLLDRAIAQNCDDEKSLMDAVFKCEDMITGIL